jgi:hypothetical protein
MTLTSRYTSRVRAAVDRGGGPRRLSLTLARAVLATALAGLIMLWSPSYWVGLAAAVALPVVLGGYPLALVVVACLVAQEVNPASGYDGVTTLGHQSYYAGKVPLILVLAATAAAVMVVRHRSIGLRGLGLAAKAMAAIIGALILLSIGSGLVHGQSIPSAINQNARPFLLLAIGLLVGLAGSTRPNQLRTVKLGAGLALGGLMLAAIVAVGLGQSADRRVSRYFIFYDSALSAIAAAVFLALLLHVWSYDWRPTLVMAVAAGLVVTSFRLTIWVASAVVLGLAWLLTPERTRTARRLGLAVAGLLVVLAVAPGLASDVGARLTGVAVASGNGDVATPGPRGNTTSGGGGDPTGGDTPVDAGSGGAVQEPVVMGEDVVANSAKGHLRDIRVGWQYVQQHPWTGLGPQAHQPPGLSVATTSSRIYVHNEWLLTWLRFGPLGALLVTGLLTVIAGLALKTLRRPGEDVVGLTAAFLGLIAPLAMLTAPFLTTTSRWPLALGIGAGLLASREPSGRRI